jgi:hypothetical protein
LAKLPQRQNFDINEITNKSNPIDVFEAFKIFITAKKEYEIVIEQENTKRKFIDTNLQKFLIKNESKKEFIKEYLANQFSDRREIIERNFNLLDKVLDEDKDNVAIQILDTIGGIIRESPLKEIDKIGKAFEDDDEELII